MAYLRLSPTAERSPTPPQEEGRWTRGEGMREPREGFPHRPREGEGVPAAVRKSPSTYTPPEERPILTPLRRGEVGTDLYTKPKEGSWSWERWGRRSEELLARVARDLEMVYWGAVGLLAGLVVGAVPALDFGFDRYPFVIAQPAGALVGLLLGSGLARLWWQRKETP
jgi:hypothetical protein